MRTFARFLPLTFFAVATLAASAADYYRWRGPDLNGISKERRWSTAWPDEGPKILWRASVGFGFSSFAVANGRAFTLGNTNDQDTVFCFDAATGKQVWQHTYPSKLAPNYYEGGPSSTPTVDGKLVYTLGKMGDLFCFEAASGKVRWATNLATGMGAKPPTWFFASSPVVDGNRLLLNAGAAGMVLDKRTGRLLWRSASDSPGGYSSAVFFGKGGNRAMLLAFEKEFGAVRLKDGEVLWRHPWKTMYEVNAADPIVVGDDVFISTGYQRGGALLRIKQGAVELVWENKNLRNQFNPSVLIDGHLYGFDGDGGRPESRLRCVEFATGEVKWTEPTGFGSLMAADGKLIVLNEKGTLMIIEAQPGECKKLASAQVLGGRCWTTPVLANGRIYCRNAAGAVVCLEVSGK